MMQCASRDKQQKEDFFIGEGFCNQWKSHSSAGHIELPVSGGKGQAENMQNKFKQNKQKRKEKKTKKNVLQRSLRLMMLKKRPPIIMLLQIFDFFCCCFFMFLEKKKSLKVDSRDFMTLCFPSDWFNSITPKEKAVMLRNFARMDYIEAPQVSLTLKV